MDKRVDKSDLFERMPVKRAVLKQIVPTIVGQMIVLIYNLADTYFVGLLNEPRQTAAVTVVGPIFVMLTAVSNLFAVGGASVMAHALGTKDEQRARQVSALAFWGGLFAAVVFSALFFALASPILRLGGATDETYALAFGYAKWVVVFGGAGTILNLLLGNLVRAEGGATAAALGVALGGVCNIVLDPLFVLPQFLDMGAEGAGAATAISNMLSALFFIAYVLIKRRRTVVCLSPACLRGAGRYLKNVLSIGFPSCVQYALTVVAVAALGIVKKLDQLPLYFSIGVANGLLPLLAYNYASGDQQRRHAAFVFGCGVSLGFALLCLVVYEIFAPALTGLFIADARTIEYSAAFLRIMVVAMPMMSVCYPMIVQFQAMGRVKESLVCSIFRKGVLDIPLLFLFNALIPLYGCMAVQPVVDSVSLVVALCFYRKLRHGAEA